MTRSRTKMFLAQLVAAIVLLQGQGCGTYFQVSQLSSENGSGAGVFTAPHCQTEATPVRVPLRFLSNSEYDHVVADIFGSKKKISVEARFDQINPGPSGFSNSSLTSDPGSREINDFTVEKYYNAAGIVANDLIASKVDSDSAYSRLASCALGQPMPSDTCVNAVVNKVARLAWRREINTQAEFTRLKAFFTRAPNFDSGFRDFTRALLVSPNFLVITEAPENSVSEPQTFALNQTQLATRLALFLWQSAPDEELLDFAQSSQLEKQLGEQIGRMLKDPRAKRLASVLTNEWLGAGKIKDLGLDIDAATLQSMIDETRLLFEDIIASDRSFLSVIDADYTFVNKRLADYYGLPFGGADPNQFYRTDISATPRRGALNQAAFLISTAGSPTETHPVLRGKLVALKIACMEIPPPPPGIDTSLPEDLPLTATPAEMLKVHTLKQDCNACHRVLDPHGLPLETFDPMGKWRATYSHLGNRPIDQSGQLPFGRAFTTTSGFMTELAESREVRSCLVRKLMSAGLARRVESRDDRCVSESVSQLQVKPDSKFRDLITDIVFSRQFRTQTTEAP